MASEIEMLKKTSGAKFFDKSQNNVFPEKDFYLCTETDKFNFVMKPDSVSNGSEYRQMKPLYI